VVEPLRHSSGLSRQLQQQSGRTNLRLRDEGAAPEKYRVPSKNTIEGYPGGGNGSICIKYNTSFLFSVGAFCAFLGPY
jgi:hypothetical protein